MELYAEQVDISTLSTQEAQQLAELLNIARESMRGLARPTEELRRYSEGTRLGRSGGYTAFRLGGDAIALTHTTHMREHTEIDALARFPRARGQQLGTQALEYTLEQAAALGHTSAGLFTPPRNLDFYAAHGFRVDSDIAADPYVRMDRTLA